MLLMVHFDPERESFAKKFRQISKIIVKSEKDLYLGSGKDAALDPKRPDRKDLDLKNSFGSAIPEKSVYSLTMTFFFP